MTHQKKNSEKNTNPHNSPSLEFQKELSKKVAILFTDVKGSSAFYKTHGNLAGRIMIQKLNDMLFPIVKAYKGIIVKTIGDSIMACFPSPKETLWAAIAMQKRLLTHNMDHSPKDHLLVRIAMNYGYGIVEEKDVFGDVVNIAAKLISCCDAQQIIVTESFYLETQNTSEVTFSPYHVKEKKDQIGNINIYQVNWEKIKDISYTKNIYLFSVRMEKSSDEESSTEGIENILPLIKQNAYKVINVEETGIDAIFGNSKTCLETAQKTLQKYLHSSSEGEDLPHILKIGLHSTDGSVMGNGKSLEFFDESINARDSAQPYETVITSKFYSDLTPDLKQTCSPVKSSLNTQDPLYLFNWEKLDDQTPVLTSLIPYEGIEQGAAHCFYCGSARHPTNRCPSKLIQKSTNYLEKLGYTPLHEISRIFHENFLDIVKPLKSGSEEERFEILFKEDKNDPYSLGFFSFYEITEIFQLRSLQQLYLEKTADKAPPLKKSGLLMMGKDCLRVSRFDEAEQWFDKAIKEQANDYRPYVALGILSMEKSNSQQALSYFKNALSFSISDIQKRYIYLLIARLYEVSGSLPHAEKEIEKVIAMFHNGSEVRYYLAVILAKSGKTKQAIKIFRKLLYQSPRYYLMVSLNPELNIARNEIVAFLNRELINIRTMSQKSFENIGKTIEKYSMWFSKDDGDYRTACELFQKASIIFQVESLSGLMDIPGFEVSVNLLLRLALERRQSNLRKKISKFKKNLDDSSKYLALFPYKGLLSKRDFKLIEDFETLLEDAKEAVKIKALQSLEEAQTLTERLSEQSAKLISKQNWLEIMKKSLFTLECSFKTVGFFFATATTTAFLFTIILILYQGFENSFSSITATQSIGFIKFGLFAGLFSGIFGTVIWFKKNFSKMQKKIGF